MLNPRRQLDLRKAIEKAVDELPPMPAAVSRLVTLAKDEDVSTTEIERLLASDGALASKTLRVVNSAYYGMAGQVRTLSHAVLILGMVQLQSLVLSIAAHRMLSSRNSRSKAFHRELWNYSLCTSAMAALLASHRKMERDDTDLVHIGGLLHDIGSLFLLGSYPDVFAEVRDFARRNGVPVVQAEVMLLGFSSGWIGRELASRWKFPDDLKSLVGPADLDFSGETTEIQKVVYAASCLSQSALFPQVPRRPMHVAVADYLVLGPDEIAAITVEALRQLQSTAELYGILAA